MVLFAIGICRRVMVSGALLITAALRVRVRHGLGPGLDQANRSNDLSKPVPTSRGTPAALSTCTMEKLVEMLYSHGCCWPMPLDCANNPWYPTVKLSRQIHPGAWNAVLNEVAVTLASPANRTALRTEAMDVQEQDLAAEVAELGSSGLFDPAWYLQVNPDVGQTGLDPLMHFVWFGWREGRWPNPYFDPAWYMTTYPDMVASAMNPLLHYLRHGDLAGCRPIAHFDPTWYRTAYDLASDRPALRHFLPRRRTGRFVPCAALYAVPALPPSRDRVTDNDDLFCVYLENMAHGQKEAFPELALLEASGLVDASYYLLNDGGVREAAIDPVVHFCRYGWHEKRKPNIYFDTDWYLSTNPRVERLGINPLVHYVCEGETANRRPVPYFDPDWYRTTYGIPPEQCALAHYLLHRRSQAFSPTPLFDVDWYVSQHADALGHHSDPFAHFLLAGTREDVDPSPRFNAAEYRRRHGGHRSKGFHDIIRGEIYNPLVHCLQTEYY
jgi:hypothetical protein